MKASGKAVGNLFASKVRPTPKLIGFPILSQRSQSYSNLTARSHSHDDSIRITKRENRSMSSLLLQLLKFFFFSLFPRRFFLIRFFLSHIWNIFASKMLVLGTACQEFPHALVCGISKSCDALRAIEVINFISFNAGLISHWRMIDRGLLAQFMHCFCWWILNGQLGVCDSETLIWNKNPLGAFKGLCGAKYCDFHSKIIQFIISKIAF